jgi:hypothetical protein
LFYKLRSDHFNKINTRAETCSTNFDKIDTRAHRLVFATAHSIGDASGFSRLKITRLTPTLFPPPIALDHIELIHIDLVVPINAGSMETGRKHQLVQNSKTALANRGEFREHLNKKNTRCATRWSATSAASSPGRGAANTSSPSTTASRKESTAPARSGQASTRRWKKGRLRPPKKVSHVLLLEFLICPGIATVGFAETLLVTEFCR